MNRKYELVYVVSPDATDEQVSRTCTSRSRLSCSAWAASSRRPSSWGRRKLAYRNRPSQGRHLRPRRHPRQRRADEGDRSPLKVSDLVIRHLVVRVDEEQARRRTDARQAHRYARAAVVWRAACPPIGSRVKDSGSPMTIVTIASTWARRRAMNGRKSFGGGAAAAAAAAAPARRRAGQGSGPAPSDVPSPQGLQVLRGQDRRHQLQGHQAADAVRPGARQDPPAPHLGHLCHAPAEAAHGNHARAPAGADSVHSE